MQCMKCCENRNDVCERKALKRIVPYTTICDICYGTIIWDIHEAYNMILGKVSTIEEDFDMYEKICDLSKRR